MKRKTYTDLLTRLAKGTDASLYRLVPERVEVVNDEESIRQILSECRAARKPLTFKGGGTSLSGQTITDSVLVEIGLDFGKSSISPDGKLATFPCSITGEHANLLLKRYGRKIGPSPASIKSARIGGIVSNNASGSSYGITYNSYHTIRSMRIILADGFLLNTASPENRKIFTETHWTLVEGIKALRKKVLDNPAIATRIRHKYELKNTCGYGVNSLIDFEDPVDIIMHLMIGSEGTLGFISEVTFETVPDLKYKATAMIYYPSVREASRAILPLRKCSVSAAELMDRNALRAVENEPGMPEVLKTLPDEAVALLIDTSADDKELLQKQCDEIERLLSGIPTLYPVSFTTDPKLYATYWRVRSGLFTSAAAGRPKGTVSIIEDIAFRGEILGEALTDIRDLLVRYQYPDAVMWGHLLDGNVHFTVFPDINHPEGVDNYAAFMEELVDTVLRHDGSLKAEHGTGRNMAPFVCQEWGEEIYGMMKDIKQLFDPWHILNPGVIINNNPLIFIRNLKEIPIANELIDKCIECGFCEIQCPSRNLTLTPRQRIVAYRELSNLAAWKDTFALRYAEIKEGFQYSGNETCATDGLCGTTCPVGINTGLLIKELRWQENSERADKIASYIVRNFSKTTHTVRRLLGVPHGIAKLTGYSFMEFVTRSLFKLSGHKFPLWTRYTPSGNRQKKYRSDRPEAGQPTVVYFPSCITRTMGPSADYREKASVTEKTIELLHRAGYAILYPDDLSRLCCGMAFSSKGFRSQAAEKEKELQAALLAVSDNGRIPILCDMSPCLLHMRETLNKSLHLYEPVEFIHDFLLDKLVFTKLPLTVAVHSTCSTTKMGISEKLSKVASRCAEKVVTPMEVTCCGWAGDRGFFYPELNASALRRLPSGLEGATEGYSNSRTCEIGLTMNSGISYKSIVYLVEKATWCE